MLKRAINGKTGHSSCDCRKAKISTIEMKMIKMLIKMEAAFFSYNKAQLIKRLDLMGQRWMIKFPMRIQYVP
ncbi:MAG TPA: hypothetical protein ENH70_07425 [Desulfobacteraceae bacterium]|nr:hypothetical protein [Desulfobacteraceae bacterium]